MTKINKFDVLWNTLCDNKLNNISVWNNFILGSLDESSEIRLYNKNSGTYLKNIMTEDMGMFGIKSSSNDYVINDLIFRLDTSMGLCQIYNLNLNLPIAVFGYGKLINPTCMTGFYKNNIYNLYIFDSENNNITEYLINIKDNEIIDSDNQIYMNLGNLNVNSILIDKEYNRLIVCDEDKFLITQNGKIIKEYQSKIKKVIIFKDTYVLLNNEKMKLVSFINRDDLKYNKSLFSDKLKMISDIVTDNEHIFIIDNNCLLAKLYFEPETNNSNNLLLITIGLLISKLLF